MFHFVYTSRSRVRLSGELRKSGMHIPRPTAEPAIEPLIESSHEAPPARLISLTGNKAVMVIDLRAPGTVDFTVLPNWQHDD
jgi:hypothetical protein